MDSRDRVELSCQRSGSAFIVSLVINVGLMATCAFYAFKTRKLPDNYNESKFITFCVYTNLVIWVAFIPTFLTANSSLNQVTLLSVAVLTNCTVILCCLYVPKVYAVYCVGRDDLNLNAGTPMTVHPQFIPALIGSSRNGAGIVTADPNGSRMVFGNTNNTSDRHNAGDTVRRMNNRVFPIPESTTIPNQN